MISVVLMLFEKFSNFIGDLLGVFIPLWYQGVEVESASILELVTFVFLLFFAVRFLYKLNKTDQNPGKAK